MPHVDIRELSAVLVLLLDCTMIEKWRQRNSRDTYKRTEATADAFHQGNCEEAPKSMCALYIHPKEIHLHKAEKASPVPNNSHTHRP